MKRVLALILVALLTLTGALAEMPVAPEAELLEGASVEEAPAEEALAEATQPEAAPAEEAPAEATQPEAAPAEEASAEEAPAEEAPAEATSTVEAQPEAAETGEAKPEETAGRLNGIKIGIDPGHQANDNNETPKVKEGEKGVESGTAEYAITLDIALKLRDLLVAEGAEVIMTRETNDVNLSNEERAAMLNEQGVDLALHIHCDNFDFTTTQGIGLFVRKTGDTAEESAKAAECIAARMAEVTGAKKRDTIASNIYISLNASTVPCMLVMCGFLSNPDEDALLNTPEYQQKLAEGMCAGICDHFEK